MPIAGGPGGRCRAPEGERAAAAIGGRVYVIGGFDADDVATGAVSVYDTHTDQWHGLSPMPTPRGLLKVAEVNGRLYAADGHGDTDGRRAGHRDRPGHPAADHPAGHRQAPRPAGRGGPGGGRAG